MPKAAELAFFNGRIHTGDDGQNQALAVWDGKVAAVGSDDQVREEIAPSTEVVDLAGRAVLPGLIDAHAHLAALGTYGVAIDCRSPGVSSIEDIVTRIRERTRHSPPGTWIRGRGYDHTRLREGRHPSRSDLDAAAPDHPVLLTRVCGHFSSFNTKAMEAVGLTEDSPDPQSGRFDREDGRMVGLARESAQRSLQQGAALSAQELRQALIHAQQAFLAAGCTSVHDAGGLMGSPLREMLALDREGRWRLRVYTFASVGAEGADEEAAYSVLKTGQTSGFGSDRIRLGAFKVMTDGSSSGPSAATREGYEIDPHDTGLLIWEQEELNEVIGRAHRAGFQASMHAVGDRAVECALDAYDSLGPWDPHLRRHRIEHCAMLPGDLQERVVGSGVVPVMQPVFLWEFGDGYVRNYGRARADVMFPAAAILRRDRPVAGSSDAPVTDLRPLFGMQVAMERRTIDGDLVGPGQAITFPEALRMYTSHAAYAAFDEDRLGSLEPGKLADLVILEEDPARVPARDLGHLAVLMTVVGGEVAYASPEWS